MPAALFSMICMHTSIFNTALLNAMASIALSTQFLSIHCRLVMP